MKRATLKRTLSLGVLTVLFAAPSFGQSEENENSMPTKTVAEIFNDMDANDDNKLSKDEVKEPLKENFEKMDLDKDNFISFKEFEKAMKPENAESAPMEKENK